MEVTPDVASFEAGIGNQSVRDMIHQPIDPRPEPRHVLAHASGRTNRRPHFVGCTIGGKRLAVAIDNRTSRRRDRLGLPTLAICGLRDQRQRRAVATMDRARLRDLQPTEPTS